MRQQVGHSGNPVRHSIRMQRMQALAPRGSSSENKGSLSRKRRPLGSKRAESQSIETKPCARPLQEYWQK